MAQGKPYILTTSDGQSDTVTNWAAKTGIKRRTILGRIQQGWSVDEALKPLDADYLTANGERLSVAEWARRTGIYEQTIHSRVKRGWSDEQALGMIPPPPKSGTLEFQGEFLTMAEIARRLGISHEALRQRLLSGWKPEDAFSLGNVQGTIMKPNPKRRGRPKLKPPPTD